ncbi:Transmembrane protein 234 [Seminavis robusta]|uniref:Transmembrane protein 234 n=1 Tax=Seminavis robusta TaxID=568900 RepID=A0A9N8HWN1_9STRA|nr:Transmembrane protein 234 [Seminavis robusta]|eukprot:Sro1673_g290260.1 Transmembrane protein 234 (150) ;mRNA; r:15362-15811
MELLDVVLLILVGAFWGCTNPLLRKGASDAGSIKEEAASTNDHSLLDTLQASAKKFINVRVWLPYAMNQFGSVLFYVALSRSDLTLAVPVCNALALVFSMATSFALGERVDRPLRAVAGSALVMTGVGICLHSREGSTSDGTKDAETRN